MILGVDFMRENGKRDFKRGEMICGGSIGYKTVP